jgi:hypothetical protein
MQLQLNVKSIIFTRADILGQVILVLEKQSKGDQLANKQ